MTGWGREKGIKYGLGMRLVKGAMGEGRGLGGVERMEWEAAQGEEVMRKPMMREVARCWIDDEVTKENGCCIGEMENDYKCEKKDRRGKWGKKGRKDVGYERDCEY